MYKNEKDLLQHRTDETDAFDTLYMGCEKFPTKLLRGYRPQGLCDAHNKRTHELLTLGKIQASLFCPHLIAIVDTLYIGCEKFPFKELMPYTASGVL